MCAEQRVDSGGLKSLWRPNEGRYIQKRVSITRWLKRVEGTEKPKRARRRKPDTAKADLVPVARVPEGRVSRAIWNPKGMRRSIGL